MLIYPGRFVGAVPDPAAPTNTFLGAVPDLAAPINIFYFIKLLILYFLYHKVNVYNILYYSIYAQICIKTIVVVKVVNITQSCHVTAI